MYLLRSLHSLFLLVWLIVSTFIFAVLIILSRVLSARISRWFARSWAIILIFLGGVRLDIKGLEKLDRKKKYFFVSNHQSAADIVVLYVSLPYYPCFLAKKSLFYIPFFGWGMAALGYIPIERKNPREARKTIDKTAKLLNKGRTSLIVFPEGTRSTDGNLQPFKLGVFSLAVNAGLDVVPVALRGTREILPKGTYFIKPHAVSVLVADPIPTHGFGPNNKKELADQAEEKIKKLLEKPDNSTDIKVTDKK